jgi:uncharacterized membrane protein YcaP (DUF421 family)
MKKEDIHFTDIRRWLFGEAPPEFLIEVLLRTFLIYIFLLLVVRLMGKRMTGQITLTELCVVITLGAIVSPVMQMPDKGILYGMLVLACAYIFQRGINLWGFKNEKVENLTQGTLSTIIRDGELDTEELKRLRLSKHQLFAILREKKIQNLGEIERAYWEACGICTIYKANNKKPGLAILPEEDHSIFNIQHQLDSGLRACGHCGHVQNIQQGLQCTVCHQNEWTKVYINA